ncbi:MAG: M23 family metallopeptidase, partial [Pseudomonadota bacterium]
NAHLLMHQMPQDKRTRCKLQPVLRHLVHEQVRVRRNNRPFLQIKPYLKISTRLAPATRDFADLIPSFNPVKLYASSSGRSAGDTSGASETGYGAVETEFIELLDGTLPIEDRQELAPSEVLLLVRETIDDEPEAPSVKIGLQRNVIESLTPDYLAGLRPDDNDIVGRSGNVTTLVKSADPDDGDGDDLERREVRVVRAADGDSVETVLARLGVPGWQAAAASEATEKQIKGGQLRAGQEVHVTLVPSLDTLNQNDVIKFSVFDEGHTHRATIRRNAASEFTAHASPDQDALIRAMLQSSTDKFMGSLYASIYATGLAQGLRPDQIMTVLRIHANDTDFRRSLRAGDSLEVFVDLRKTESGELEAGEILYTSLTTNGETRRFWRFRSQDGDVDYFNERGENPRRFLMRKPVRGANVRRTSGFGMRRHPILNRMRLHAGVDFAAKVGTPILAAGNGIIAYARHKGAYGRHIRIRHANGYETTYSHMHRFARGIRPGLRVKQGRLIGYVGNTGLSTGPHLHFEVRVNKRPVDPLKIEVPRERTLLGRELKDFQRERSRITTVMRSPPVRMANR